jgi:hypothetical protein
LKAPPQVIECADDQEAAEKAKQFINGKDVEVWQDRRGVVKYPHT